MASPLVACQPRMKPRHNRQAESTNAAPGRCRGARLPMNQAKVWLNTNGPMLVATLPVYVINLGGSQADAGLVTGALALTALLFRPVVGWLTDTWRRRPLVLIGTSCYGLASVFYLLAGSIPFLVVGRIVNGFGLCCYTTAANAYIEKAYLASYSGGLGVTNRDGVSGGGDTYEGTIAQTSVPGHTMDNELRYDSMLFDFGAGNAFQLKSVTVGWWQTDSDLTILAYTGTGTPTFTDSSASQGYSSLLGSGWYSRMLRSSMIEVLHQDFIRTARAKGLGRTRVLLRHVLPNAVLPLIPMIGIDIGIFMGGLVVVESVFGWPGIGQLAWQAIQQVDIPVIVGVTTVSAVAIVGGNLIADLVLPWVDPRIDVKK